MHRIHLIFALKNDKFMLNQKTFASGIDQDISINNDIRGIDLRKMTGDDQKEREKCMFGVYQMLNQYFKTNNINPEDDPMFF